MTGHNDELQIESRRREVKRSLDLVHQRERKRMCEPQAQHGLPNASAAINISSHLPNFKFYFSNLRSMLLVPQR